MPRVLVAGKLHESGVAILQDDPTIRLDYITSTDPASMVPYLDTAEAILLRTQPLDAAMIARCPALRIVSRHGVGYDAVDVDALSGRRIPLTIVGDVNARTVAEHAMMLLMAASRRLLPHDAASRAGGNWEYRNSLESREISGKTLLIIGFGRIGHQLARMAMGFGIEVLAHDPFFSGAPPDGVRMADDLSRVLGDADLISLHIPKTDRPVLGAGEIALLKPGAVVVNTSRGGAVDEAALASALATGRLHGAGLDVYGEEPPAAENPVVGCATAVLTPHSAGMTLECAERMAIVAARNIVDYFGGRLDPALVVNAGAIGFGAGGDQ